MDKKNIDKIIKDYADNRDRISLKYIFVSALDVDPTFVQYEAGYNYCKSIPGLLESHVELTPFREDKIGWDEAYWTSLKTDLKKNFSDRRMMHMKDVAQIFLADKIADLLKERDVENTSSPIVPTAVPKDEEKVAPVIFNNATPSISRAEQQNRNIEEEKRKLNEENRKTEAARQAKLKRIEQQNEIRQTSTPIRHTGDSSKKVMGIAVAVLAVVTVVLILLLK